eukprot:12919211-Prorocentrum_lima.AAC.1
MHNSHLPTRGPSLVHAPPDRRRIGPRARYSYLQKPRTSLLQRLQSPTMQGRGDPRAASQPRTRKQPVVRQMSV